MGRTGNGGRTWFYPAAGVVVALGLTFIPGLPLGADRWPATGAFGAFTWAAWLVSTALAVTLGLLAIRLGFRSRRPTGEGPGEAVPAPGAGRVRPGEGGRVLRVAVGFGLLAVLAFVAAARVELIEKHPGAALGVAVAAVLALRLLNLAVMQMSRSGPGDGFPSDDETKPIERPALRRGRAEALRGDDDEEGERPADPPRWVNWLATLSAVALVLIVALGIAVRWLGPGLGLVLPAVRPTPIFWGETAYFEYDAARRAGGSIEPYLVPPHPESPAAIRRGVLPAGAKLAIKGWVDNGAEVRVEHDPNGRLAGEWGYVRLNDLNR